MKRNRESKSRIRLINMLRFDKHYQKVFDDFIASTDYSYYQLYSKIKKMYSSCGATEISFYKELYSKWRNHIYMIPHKNKNSFPKDDRDLCDKSYYWRTASDSPYAGSFVGSFVLNPYNIGVAHSNYGMPIVPQLALYI